MTMNRHLQSKLSRHPVENKYDYATFASLGYVTTTDYTSNKDEGDVKTFGLSVRCVKLE